MKGNKYTKIFILAFVAAGFACLVAGIIVFVTAQSQLPYVIGIAMIGVGIADTVISLLVLAIVLLKNWLDRRQTEDNTHDRDNKTN